MTALEGFDEAAISEIASSGSMMRGKKYAGAGVVTIDVSTERRVDARVRGSELYRVSLLAGSAGGGTRTWSCNCMAAFDGSFCKHCVAVALVAADSKGVGNEATAGIAAFLASRSHDQLVALIDEAAALDDRLRQRLEAMAMLNSGEALDVKEWKKRVTKAFGRGYVDYRRAPGWAADVHEALATISDIGDAGYAEAAAVLAEHAHKRAESAMGRVDDSDGWITNIANEIGVIHVAACIDAAFPPKKLAKRLVDLELKAELDTFHRSAVSHADALGDQGLAEFGRLVDRAFDALPANADRWGPAFRIRNARIGHAIAVGDADRLIEVKGNDLHSSSDYLEIIAELRRAGRMDEANAWADRGLADMARLPHQMPAMRAVKAELLIEAGDAGSVDVMAWEAFDQRPTPSLAGEYLQMVTDKAEARRRIVGLVEAQVAAAPLRQDNDEGGFEALGLDPHVGRTDSERGVSASAEILLRAGLAEQAWTVALLVGTDWSTWEQIVAECDASALDRLALGLRQVERHIARKGKPHYRRAAKALADLDAVAAAADLHHVAVAIRADVRQRHKNKPGLMQLI